MFDWIDFWLEQPLREKLLFAFGAIGLILIAIGGVPLAIFHFGGIAFTGDSAVPPDLAYPLVTIMWAGLLILFCGNFLHWILGQENRRRLRGLLGTAVKVLARAAIVLAVVYFLLLATSWIMKD